MSAVVVITPMVIANWTVISAAVTAAVGHEWLKQVRAEAEAEVRRGVRSRAGPKSTWPRARSCPRRLELPRRWLSSGMECGRRSAATRRGALKLCLEGPHLSKAALLAIGEELMGRVTQQYVYHRIMSELQRRNLSVVSEEVSPERSVKIRVRNL